MKWRIEGRRGKRQVSYLSDLIVFFFEFEKFLPHARGEHGLRVREGRGFLSARPYGTGDGEVWRYNVRLIFSN
jgi:hypothetical protein